VKLAVRIGAGADPASTASGSGVSGSSSLTLVDAIALAEPQQMLLFTALTGNWQTDRLLVNMLTKYLRRDKLTFKMAWAIEPNPSGDGYHAHAWTHGDWLPKRTLQNRAEQVGLGWCDVRPVTYHGNFSYVVKDAT